MDCFVHLSCTLIIVEILCVKSVSHFDQYVQAAMLPLIVYNSPKQPQNVTNDRLFIIFFSGLTGEKMTKPLWGSTLWHK